MRPRLLPLLTAPLLGACSSWQVQTQPLPEYLSKHPGQTVRVWDSDNIRSDVRAPLIRGDSLVSSDSTSNTAGTPLYAITGYAVHKGDPFATIVVIGAAIAAVDWGLNQLGPAGSNTNAF